jgi:hypothetical protein
MIFDNIIEKINSLEDKNRTVEITERPILKHFFEILKNICNINRPYYIIQTPGKEEIKLRTLIGNERLKIFNTLSRGGEVLSNFFSKKNADGSYEKFFPNLELENEDVVWNEFIRIYTRLKKNPRKPLNMKILRKKLTTWLSFYLLIRGGNISPYVHAWTWHIPEMLEKHINLNYYNQQGLEKLNDFIRNDYFRSTNRNRTSISANK